MKNMYFIWKCRALERLKAISSDAKPTQRIFYRGLKKDHEKDGFKGSIMLFTYQSDSENETPSMNDLKPLKIECF